MLTALSDATPSNGGGKAATLGLLLRYGLPVPDGFVVPVGRDQDTHPKIGPALRTAIAHELERLGDPVVAVRSSAANEDTAHASAAGQYESIVGARGVDDVCEAIAACRASAHTARVVDYWHRTGGSSALYSAHSMAVLVQRVIEANVSGVMFTPQQAGDPTRIEASWGLGLAIVGGTVTPDAYEVAADGAITCTVAGKETRTDLNMRGGVITSTVAAEMQTTRTLDDDTVATLAKLGIRIATFLEGPQDVEWAVADGTVWILQTRPITAALPATHARYSTVPAQTLTGRPGSHGNVTATARVVRGPSDFPTVQRGDVVICPYTDPGWTPLFTIAAGVVTETGGALSHAAIVAREYGVPAVLGVTHATTRIQNGDKVTLDGTAGTVTLL
ncbi:PEP/pyruvate-binding domain-containing protein [Phytoactinopolyspora mesophila]|uniref:Pyruvate, phosphate dikinase n=1 Tax=Phytoactinopolyspora mesophila TaxID=2650750 RepID=A0A7K3LZT7_9ACTN|nr:PEP/pyruvate-binding domain-containing protein [Phytoactinopolyspora mesophila]NDL56555.1 pyruvate, phosphate dikinase [Phytoactinopolyspora mesophila]